MEMIYYVAASLDGYIATPDGGIEWLKPFEGGAEDYGYGEFYASVEGVVMGRATYEKSLAFGEWPYPGKPYWVLSRSSGTTPRAAAEELRGRGLRRVWLVGGGKAATALRAEGLLTEIIVSFIPVLLGAGIPLFDGQGASQPLHLLSSRSYPSGIVQSRYATVL